MELAEPKPHKNQNWIPVIVYKNKEHIGEFNNIQETFSYFRPLMSCSNKEIYDFITEGVFNLKSYKLSNDIYDFRTYEQRRKRHFEEVEFNKQTGRKGR